jgi:hypothetical protein
LGSSGPAQAPSYRVATIHGHRALIATGGGLPARATASSARHSVSPLARHFRVFRNRRAHAADFATPAMAQILTQQYGLELDQTQVVTLSPSLRVWLYPGTQGACMYWPDNEPRAGLVRSGICNPIMSSIESGDMVGEDTAAPGTGGGTVIGLVPDGVTSATVTLSDGTQRTVPVANNVYSAPAGAQGFQSVSLRNASGTVVHTAAGVP